MFQKYSGIAENYGEEGEGGRSRFPVLKFLGRPKTVSEQSKMLITVCRADVTRHISSLQKIDSIASDIKNKPRNTENWKINAKKLLCIILKLVSSN